MEEGAAGRIAAGSTASPAAGRPLTTAVAVEPFFTALAVAFVMVMGCTLVRVDVSNTEFKLNSGASGLLPPDVIKPYVRNKTQILHNVPWLCAESRLAIGLTELRAFATF